MPLASRRTAVGVGTVLYAVGIGPMVHVLLPRFVVLAEAPIASQA